jgi:hypothetical protein
MDHCFSLLPISSGASNQLCNKGRQRNKSGPNNEQLHDSVKSCIRLRPGQTSASLGMAYLYTHPLNLASVTRVYFLSHQHDLSPEQVRQAKGPRKSKKGKKHEVEAASATATGASESSGPAEQQLSVQTAPAEDLADLF